MKKVLLLVLVVLIVPVVWGFSLCSVPQQWTVEVNPSYVPETGWYGLAVQTEGYPATLLGGPVVTTLHTTPVTGLWMHQKEKRLIFLDAVHILAVKSPITDKNGISITFRREEYEYEILVLENRIAFGKK